MQVRTWDGDDDSEAWGSLAKEWYRLQLHNWLRVNLFKAHSHAFGDLLQAQENAGLGGDDSYIKALERVVAWYLDRDPLTVWVEDDQWRPGEVNGGYRILWDSVDNALPTAIDEVTTDLRPLSAPDPAVRCREIQRRLKQLLVEEATGWTAEAPREPIGSALRFLRDLKDGKDGRKRGGI